MYQENHHPRKFEVGVPAEQPRKLLIPLKSHSLKMTQ